jgi:hypothetical protein
MFAYGIMLYSTVHDGCQSGSSTRAVRGEKLTKVTNKVGRHLSTLTSLGTMVYTVQ